MHLRHAQTSRKTQQAVAVTHTPQVVTRNRWCHQGAATESVATEMHTVDYRTMTDWSALEHVEFYDTANEAKGRCKLNGQVDKRETKQKTAEM